MDAKDRRIAELEQRVAALEALLRAGSTRKIVAFEKDSNHLILGRS